MGRPLFGRPAGPVRAVGAVGAVAAAVGAHVGAGGAVPSPALLIPVVVVVGALTRLVDRLPARLRTVRLQLTAAVALQPVLHAVFDLRAPALLMVLAHLGAAAGTAWWLDRGAARCVDLARIAARRRPAAAAVAMPTTARPRPAWSPMAVTGGRDPLVGMRRRGPPSGPLSLIPARS